MDHLGSRGRVHTPKGSFDLKLNLVGRFNVLNALGAAGAALALGALPAQVGAGLAALPAVPGRLEAVPNAQGFGVLVDYAHTPDALDSVLAALRELQPKRLICVVGCGGDRDRSKRPLMAQAAARGSDWVIATSDNPRSEAPEAILAGMKPGLRSQDRVIVDRGQAIAEAILAAQPGDLVLIAGKGHETTQEIAGKKLPFDDRVVAKAALESRA
jgi:UDP-N-acetylmuramoyl-L-alanyl-D-glutamate--2,6-diaminopimelate ligase